MKLLTQIAGYEPDDAMVRLGTTEHGLTETVAAARLTQFGPNQVAHERESGWMRQLVHAYNNPFNLLLTVLAVISYFTEDIKATGTVHFLNQTTDDITIPKGTVVQTSTGADRVQFMTTETKNLPRSVIVSSPTKSSKRSSLASRMTPR